MLVFTRKEKEKPVRGKKGKAEKQKGKWAKKMKGKRENTSVFLLCKSHYFQKQNIYMKEIILFVDERHYSEKHVTIRRNGGRKNIQKIAFAYLCLPRTG